MLHGGWQLVWIWRSVWQREADGLWEIVGGLYTAQRLVAWEELKGCMVHRVWYLRVNPGHTQTPVSFILVLVFHLCLVPLLIQSLIFFLKYMWCGYKITGLMLEHLLLKKLHNRNVTLNVLPSAIPTPLHANFPLLEATLQVVFWELVHEFRRFCLHCIYGLKPGSF